MTVELCKIGSTIIDVSDEEITARVSGECTDGTKFNGKTTQIKNSGYGLAKTEDGRNKFLFDFNNDKSKIAEIMKSNQQLSLNETRIWLKENSLKKIEKCIKSKSTMLY